MKKVLAEINGAYGTLYAVLILDDSNVIRLRSEMVDSILGALSKLPCIFINKHLNEYLSYTSYVLYEFTDKGSLHNDYPELFL